MHLHGIVKIDAGAFSAVHSSVTEHDPDPEGRVAQSGHRFSDKIMLKQKNGGKTIRRNVITPGTKT
jgi:hypothetical protein